MDQAPAFAALPEGSVAPPQFTRINFENIQANRYYYVVFKKIVRDDDGEADALMHQTKLVFTDSTLPNWKTYDKVKFRLPSGRLIKKIDPDVGDVIDMATFEDRYPESDLPYSYYRLPDALTENGTLLWDTWAPIEPIQPGLLSYQATRGMVDAELDAEQVWVFYVPAAAVGGRRRRNRSRRLHNRRRRRMTRRK
jgi:hypothetical protein